MQLTREKTRVANYLHAETESKLVAELKKEMLEIHQEQIMVSGERNLVGIFGAGLPFAEASKEDATLLYELFKEMPTGLTDKRLPDASKYGKLAICEMLKEHITKLGKDAVKVQQDKGRPAANLHLDMPRERERQARNPACGGANQHV